MINVNFIGLFTLRTWAIYETNTIILIVLLFLGIGSFVSNVLIYATGTVTGVGPGKYSETYRHNYS